jgi:radical SAM superfamily enzyme YgiQ (UPF0313 family)
MTSARPVRVLLVKPYQPSQALTICQPPLGILYLAAALRRALGERVQVSFRDMRLHKEDPASMASEIAGRYDLVGISALNCEAEAAHWLAGAVRAASPCTVLALGGPYARSEPDLALKDGGFDWVFHGEADNTFPRAVEARFFGNGDLSAIAGLSWRAAPGAPYAAAFGDSAPVDVNDLPLPAWDLVPFDVYARRHNMNGSLRAGRYAAIMTSRGCPYRCQYCHDIFGKEFRPRSADSVLAELELLKERYGVEEFQIVDDIFNLDRARMRGIARKVITRFGRRRLRFTFPNGVRGDILEPADLPLLRDMGVYDITVAVETASPRLQKLIDKNLDLGRLNRTIDAAAAAGMSVKGFFMLGFPTETREELERTVRYAVDSNLTIAHFFFVIPQQGTQLYDLAKRESGCAPENAHLDHYYARRSWYELAYGFDLPAFRRGAMLRFYLRPRRLLRVLRRTNLNQLLLGEWQFLNLTAGLRGRKPAAGTGGAR